MPIKGNKNQPVETVVVDETQSKDVLTADQVVVIEDGSEVDSNEATNGTKNGAEGSTPNTPRRRGATKGVARGPAYPWEQRHYDIMKEEAQKQASANGGVVNLSQLHKTLIEMEEFSSVPMELKELTLRNFYNARRDQLKTWNLPEGVTQRTPEQVNAILPKVGGTRTKLQLA